jgi:hypothetical protein
MLSSSSFYYHLKPLIPRWVQIALRRRIVIRKRAKYARVWPIDPAAAKVPAGWTGWPDGKRFALVLTHDVDTQRGHDRVRQLAELEMELGFRSSFNFVPRRYIVSADLRKYLTDNGFEVGVHGLYHDGQYFRSRNSFRDRAAEINRYIEDWGACGFRCPSMLHDLKCFHDLQIEYDASTFDTDPFEPQPEGVSTIFPFWVSDDRNDKGYVELPYTLPQDFTLFVLMGERNTDVWHRKLNWIAEAGGMVLLNTHPDYMSFEGKKRTIEEYPAEYYSQFLESLKAEREDEYWHTLPQGVASFCAKSSRGFRSNDA